MKASQYICLLPVFFVLAACGSDEEGPGEAGVTERAIQPEPAKPSADKPALAEPIELEPGLTMRVLSEGAGQTAEPGQTAVVHYTGWLYDEGAPEHRGEKFDSSIDRGKHFEFPLGAGAVIAGWDRGIAGMKIGEVRELTIAPELAYGERGAGGIIPPGATLVFEVELADIEGAAQ